MTRARSPPSATTGQPPAWEGAGVGAAGRLGRPAAAGRQRHRGQAACEQRALFVEGERKAEVDELAEEAGMVRPRARLVEDAARRGRDERRRRRARPVARELEP